MPCLIRVASKGVYADAWRIIQSGQRCKHLGMRSFVVALQRLRQACDTVSINALTYTVGPINSRIQSIRVRK